MTVIVALPDGESVDEEMPEGPLVGDRIYNVLGRACVIVYKRDWMRLSDVLWVLKVWVR